VITKPSRLARRSRKFGQYLARFEQLLTYELRPAAVAKPTTKIVDSILAGI